MEENYSIKINQNEGIVEISGKDKEWVTARLTELRDVFDSPVKTKKPDTALADTENSRIQQQAPKVISKKKTSGSSNRAVKNPELSDMLTKDLKDKLVAYVGDRQVDFDKALPAQAAIIATFLQDELEWPGVDQNDMYTVYSVMGWPAPGNPRAQLNNAMSRNQYFGSINEGKYILSHKGENYARHQSITATE